MTIIHLCNDDSVTADYYGSDHIVVPNAREWQYFLGCISIWHNASREKWKWKRGEARLKYRAINQVKLIHGY